ncbi:hypothetical protein B0H12DRAFT_1230790 [Mycena haematopus]|nr:hypothetical protein B0H12DRAFT_1230790 [Mycena haematopus]
MTPSRLLNTALVSQKLYGLVGYYLEWLHTHGADEDKMSIDTGRTSPASTDSDAFAEQYSDTAAQCNAICEGVILDDMCLSSDDDESLYFRLPCSDSGDDEDMEDMPRFGDNLPLVFRIQNTPMQAVNLLGMAPLLADMVDKSHSDSDTQGPAGMSNMPCELTMQIMSMLTLVDRCSLAQTCRTVAAVAGECLRAAAVAILAPFGLRFEEVRLMLAATGTVITGSAVAALMNLEATFGQSCLTFVAPRGKLDPVMEFLKFAGGYELQPHASTTRSNMFNAVSVWDFENAHGAKIQLVLSNSRDPFNTIATSPFTCEYGAWTETGLFHAYPHLTVNRRALTTPTRLPFFSDTIEETQRVWDLLHQYVDHDYQVDALGYASMHSCGVHPSCPATFRTSDDRGCMHIRFPAWDLVTYTARSDVTCWSLGGTGCLLGVLKRRADQARVSSATSIADDKWADHVLGLAALTIRPEVEDELTAWFNA